MSAAAARYRRADGLVCYWRDGRLVIHNYVAGRRVAAEPLLVSLLHHIGDWTTPDKAGAGFPGVDRRVLREALDELVARGLATRHTAGAPPNAGAWRRWEAWAPEAALFHFGVRNPEFPDPLETERELRRQALVDPPPRPGRRRRASASLRLPEPQRLGSIERVLRARRTWRRFGAREVSARQLATLLGVTWRVQSWMLPGTPGERCALKTSPSGGARHSIEAYVLIARVEGIAPGLYHYDAEAHALFRVGSRARVPEMTEYIPRQTWFAPASAAVLMTAVFERAQWRYPHPRAYRSVLLEAGHHCQTFLLAATALGLAPFCTAALADSVIERDLGIDGVSEAVIYACGVGTRPPGVAWAPWHDTAGVPRLVPPKSHRRR